MFRFKERLVAAVTAASVIAVFSGCSGMKVPSGLTAYASSPSERTEAASESTQASTDVTTVSNETKASSESRKTETTFTMDSYKAKRAAVNGTEYAIGTTYLGESENEAALEVVLAQMGISEELIGTDGKHLIDCGGNDIWFLCFSEDVTSVSVVLGDEEDGQELFKSDNPGYVFIRCVASGEVPACTVKVTGTKTGYTAYYPFMIGDKILLPNGGTVLNQSEGIDTFIDVDDNTDNSNEPEEDTP